MNSWRGMGSLSRYEANSAHGEKDTDREPFVTQDRSLKKIRTSKDARVETYSTGLTQQIGGCEKVGAHDVCHGMEQSH